MRQAQEERAYRSYVADCLWGLVRGRAPEARYWDLLHPPPEETRTPEEIIAHVRRKLEEAG